jgi:hypothetical protein
MKERMTPHIIAVTALVVFIVLGLACASTPMTFEEKKEFWLKPEYNRPKLETKMADKNIPYADQSFLYCEGGYSVKDKVFMTFSGGVVVFPPAENKHFWARYEIGGSKAEIGLDVDFAAGQSYFLFDPLWEDRPYGAVRFRVLPLNEAGIETFTSRMWGRSNGNLFPYGTKEEWTSYEEYHQFITQLWEIRKEETRKQL